MQVLNKGKRSFIVDPQDVISGGEITYDKRAVYINPGDQVELKDDVAKKLSKVYSDLMLIDDKKPKKKD